MTSVKVTTEEASLNFCEQTTSIKPLVVSSLHTGTQPLQIEHSSPTHTKFTNRVGATTGTVFQDDYFIRKYITNSDLVSYNFRESIMNFIKTVDNKDS